MQENPNITGETPKQTAPTIKGQSPLAFYLSILMLVLVVVFSGAMIALTSVTESQVASTQTQIQEKDQQLQSARENTTILIADILQKKLVPLSVDLKKVVTDFRMAARLAGVRLEGFALQDNTISTQLTASEAYGQAGHTDPAVTIIKMMRDYANPSDAQIFALEPITNIAGDG